MYETAKNETANFSVEGNISGIVWSVKLYARIM